MWNRQRIIYRNWRIQNRLENILNSLVSFFFLIYRKVLMGNTAPPFCYIVLIKGEP